MVIESGFSNTPSYLVCEDVLGRLRPVCAAEYEHPNAEANARLIASAPRLLAALVGLYERYIQAIGNEGPEAAEARCAISEAEGR